MGAVYHLIDGFDNGDEYFNNLLDYDDYNLDKTVVLSEKNYNNVENILKKLIKENNIDGINEIKQRMIKMSLNTIFYLLDYVPEDIDKEIRPLLKAFHKNKKIIDDYEANLKS